MKESKDKLKEDFFWTLDSIEWWKGKANQMIGKIMVLEEKFNADTATEEDRELYRKLLEETKNLIARGEVENKFLHEIEQKLKEANDDSEFDDSRET